MIAIVMVTGYSREYIITNLSMLLHETAHITAAAILGRKVYSIRILPVGMNASILESDLLSFKNIIIYAAGPVLNLMLALGGWMMSSYYLPKSNDMLFFISANICLTLFNLLPIFPMDGGMILKEVLAGTVGLFSAKKYTKRINRILAGILIAIGFFQLVSSNWNFSVMIIGVYVFFSFHEGGVEVALMNVKNIIYRKARLLKKGIYQARDLVVIKTLHMSEVIKQMDFDRFHIIYVLDEELNILAVLTEQEIIDGMLKYNTEITFDEFLNLEKQKNKNLS
ncbi:MAG: M50 family metallopeptidase [Clostridia bacterium]|nr:M50 family metallopeptidase [Clostridia bacterium]